MLIPGVESEHFYHPQEDLAVQILEELLAEMEVWHRLAAFFRTSAHPKLWPPFEKIFL